MDRRFWRKLEVHSRRGCLHLEGHAPVAAVEAQVKLDAAAGRALLEHSLGTLVARFLQGLPQFFNNQSGQGSESGFVKALLMSDLIRLPTILRPTKGLGTMSRIVRTA